MAPGTVLLAPVFVKVIDEDCHSTDVRREVVSAVQRSVRLHDRTLQVAGLVADGRTPSGVSKVVYRKPALCKSLREVMVCKESGIDPKDWVRICSVRDVASVHRSDF